MRLTRASEGLTILTFLVSCAAACAGRRPPVLPDIGITACPVSAAHDLLSVDALQCWFTAAHGRWRTLSHESHYAVLVVEVVSPDSEERDRKRKPQLYAEAGIPHFWRVEKGEGRLPVVYVFERAPATGTYVATGIHHDRLKVSVPFAVDIDLGEIERL